MTFSSRAGVWHEWLEKRRLLSVSLSESPLQQAAILSAEVLTASFKKNAPASAGNVSFDRIGKYVTHAVSNRPTDLQETARKTGESANTLYQKGLREIWWMGQRAQSLAGQWIVRFHDFSGSPRKQLRAAQQLLGQISGVKVERFTYLDGTFLIRTSESTGYRDLATRLSSLSGFRYVEPNFAWARPQAVPNDPSYSQQWGWTRINAPAAWDTTTGSNDIVVAVLDTGVQVTHPDLAANIFINPLETPGNGIDDDGNGFIDDVRGWNFGNNTPTVDNGDHGTHVAGTIGAVGNNSTGVTGINWSVKILPLDIFPDNFTSSSYYIAALAYLNGLKLRGVNVVASNNSYGGLGGTSISVQEAIQSNADQNILFVAAAGNDGQNISSTGFSPATNGRPNSIAVAASTSTDTRASFSNWGTNVDIAAPGQNIRSTTPTNSYGDKSGTSMASPHVAGLAALAYSIVPDASYHQIKQAILDGGDPVNWASTPTATNKRINAANTINIVRTHVSGKAFLDHNRDGVQQTGESPLRGWKIFNDTNNNGVRDASEPYANIQLNGRYDLIVSPGQQRIRLENQSGYTVTLGGSGYSFTLAQYDSSNGVDFAAALNSTGIIEGTVFVDTNGNGVRDAGEAPLGGSTVFLDVNNNGLLDPISTFVAPNTPVAIPDLRTVTSDLYVVRSGTITDVNVLLNITHLYVGDLRVTLIHPDGTRIRLANNNGGSGDNFNNTNFDDQATTSIASGSAPFAGSFRPIDSLSALNGKPAAGGWRLEIVDGGSSDIGILNSWSLSFNNANGDAVQYTSEDGTYRFSGLLAGTHRVRIVPRSGFNITAPTGGIWTQTLTPGQVASGHDFALQPQSSFNPSSVTGQVWYDANANGTRDVNDYSLVNWIAYLDTNDNDQIDPGEPVSLTDNSGNYRFDGLAPGSYSVRTAPYRGYSLSRPLAGEYNLTLGVGDSVNAGDFAYYQRTISGTVFVDNNANGNKDANDTTGLTGYTIYLDSNNNAVQDPGEAFTQTLFNGSYSFAGLDAGTYILRIASLGGYLLSNPISGALTVNLSTSNSAPNQNFGVYLNGTVSGTVYADANQNATFDTGDSYLSGWTVYFDANNNSQLDAGEPSTTTGSSGTYTLNGVKPGTPRIRTIPQSPYYPLVSTLTPTLTSGQFLSGQDFRFIHPSSLTFRDPDYPSSNHPGWNWAYYEYTGTISSVSALDAMTPVRSGITNTTGSTPIVNINTPSPRADQFGIIWSGFIQIPVDDIYTFYTTSDDGSTLAIGNTVVVDNDGAHGSQERSSFIALRQGLHAIKIRYFESTGGQALSVSWENSSFTKTTLASSSAFLAPTDPLVVPASLTAAPVGVARIDLAWSYAGTGHSGFVLQRSTDSGFTQNLQSFNISDPNARAFTDTTVISGQTYYYRLRATNGSQQSDPSNTAFATADAAPTVAIAPVSPSPRTIPVDTVTIAFSEPVSGFDLSDLVLTRNGNPVVLSGVSLNTTDQQNFTLSGLSSLTRRAGTYAITLTAPGGITDGNGNALTNSDTQSWQIHATVQGRFVFYNNSSFDGNNPAPNPLDDNAIATDKSALISGQATFNHYTTNSKGINGIMMDLTGLGGILTASDFEFRTGRSNNPSGWALLTTIPSINIRAISTEVERVTLIWPDATIKNTWLQVRLKSTPVSGLASDDVFYFGNIVGETGDTPGNSAVNALDASRVTANYSGRNFVGITSLFDFDRDGKVTALDVSIVTANYSGRNSVPLIQI